MPQATLLPLHKPRRYDDAFLPLLQPPFKGASLKKLPTEKELEAHLKAKYGPNWYSILSEPIHYNLPQNLPTVEGIRTGPPPLKKPRLSLNGTGRTPFKKISPSDHILDIRPHNHPIIRELAQNPISTTSNSEHAHAPIITCSAAFTPYDQNATNLHNEQPHRNQASGLRAMPYNVMNSSVGKFLNGNQARINPTHGFIPTQNQYVYHHAGIDHQGPNAPDFNRNHVSSTAYSNVEIDRKIKQALEYQRKGIKNPYQIDIHVDGGGGAGGRDMSVDQTRMVVMIALAGMFTGGAISYALFRKASEMVNNVVDGLSNLLTRAWEALQAAFTYAGEVLKSVGTRALKTLNTLYQNARTAVQTFIPQAPSNLNGPQGGAQNEGANAENGNFEDGEMEGPDGAPEPDPGVEGGVEGQGNPEQIDAGGAQGQEAAEQIEQASGSPNAAGGEGAEQGAIEGVANGEGGVQGAAPAEGVGEAGNVVAVEESVNAGRKAELLKELSATTTLDVADFKGLTVSELEGLVAAPGAAPSKEVIKVAAGPFADFGDLAGDFAPLAEGSSGVAVEGAEEAVQLGFGTIFQKTLTSLLGRTFGSLVGDGIDVGILNF